MNPHTLINELKHKKFIWLVFHYEQYFRHHRYKCVCTREKDIQMAGNRNRTLAQYCHGKVVLLLLLKCSFSNNGYWLTVGMTYIGNTLKSLLSHYVTEYESLSRF